MCVCVFCACLLVAWLVGLVWFDWLAQFNLDCFVFVCLGLGWVRLGLVWFVCWLGLAWLGFASLASLLLFSCMPTCVLSFAVTVVVWLTAC